MPDTAEVFTLAPRSVIHECGPLAALVWGAVWRFCQMGEGRCWASQTRIGREVGLNRDSVRRHLRTLVEAGYLEELSPDSPGRTCTYADTGRVRIGKRGSAPADPDGETCDEDTQVDAPPPARLSRTPAQPTACPPARPSRTTCATVTQPPALGSRTTCASITQPPALESRTKKDSKREYKKQSEETEQDTRGVPPRVGGDDQDRDDLDYEPGDEDQALVAEGLADFFARMTGIPVPIPRNEREAREARTRWSAPLAQIASLCGSTLRAQQVMAEALATLRSKGCIVKAPLSILGTAESLAGEQARKRASWRATNERYGPQRRGNERKPSPPAGPGRSSSSGAPDASRPAPGQPTSEAGSPSTPAGAASAKAESSAASPSSRPPSSPQASPKTCHSARPAALAWGAPAACRARRSGEAGHRPPSPRRGGMGLGPGGGDGCGLAGERRMDGVESLSPVPVAQAREPARDGGQCARG